MKRLIHIAMATLLLSVMVSPLAAERPHYYAMVVDVDGIAMVRVGSAIELKLGKGMLIFDNDEITVADDSSITIKSKDYGIFTIEENSTVTVREIVKHSGNLKLSLSRGSVVLDIEKLSGDEKVLIGTPDSEVSVKGTQFSVSIFEGKTYVVSVEGRVNVRTEGGAVDLSEGQGATIEGVQKPEPEEVDVALFEDKFEPLATLMKSPHVFKDYVAVDEKTDVEATAEEERDMSSEGDGEEETGIEEELNTEEEGASEDEEAGEEDMDEIADEEKETFSNGESVEEDETVSENEEGGEEDMSEESEDDTTDDEWSDDEWADESDDDVDMESDDTDDEWM